MSASQPILFSYSGSPYGYKTVLTLTLAGVPYSQCTQPRVMPRADLSALGINYRRIPVLVLGKDVYVDTPLILKAIEEKFLKGQSIFKLKPAERATVTILESWATSSIFPLAASLIPTSSPVMQDPKFIADRESFSGRSWSTSLLDRARPHRLSALRSQFDILENGWFADGRKWILGGDEVTLGDIVVAWVCIWVVLQLKATKGVIDEATHPKTMAWIKRFMTEFKTREKNMQVKSLSGAEAKELILSSSAEFAAVEHDAADPLRFQGGESVEVIPDDSGKTHPQAGKLLALNKKEVVLQLDSGLRFHAPRINFSVRNAKAAKL